ncbi:putative MFS transporter [Mycena olivaceomarginata]|nr:putative MFS transporter [Mycena olivaceomarginata]
MSAQTPRSETATIAGNDQQFVSSDLHSLQEKKDSVAGDDPEYATGLRLATIMSTILACTLLAALDIGIVATAIPRITDDFRQLDQVGWYGSACFLLVGTSAPMWGKLYKYFSARLVYIGSLSLFLVGSIIAAAAPNSTALIVARAIQGWGCSGTLSGSVLMIVYVAAPAKRPMLIGVWMGVFMISTIVGPVIGGAFTSEVTWRWCFWINLPVGGPVLVLLFLFFHVPKHITLISFTLALQWGGQNKPWNDGSVIAALVMFGVLTVAFVITEWLQGAYAMVPLSLLKPRIAWTNAFSNLADFQVLFYLPIYFQSIHGQSAITSGVNSLPFMATFAAGAMLSGALVGKTRFLQPYELLSAVLATAGAAILYTLDLDSSKARYVGAQILVGLGIGLGNQIPMTALQGFSNAEDVPSTTGIILMCNSISGAYFVTAAQSLFANRMLKSLAASELNIDAATVLATGASELQRVFSGDELAAVLSAYMTGMKGVFAFSLAGTAFTVLLALLIPFKRLPAHDHVDMQTEKE